MKKPRFAKVVLALLILPPCPAFAGKGLVHAVHGRNGVSPSPDGLYTVRYTVGDASEPDHFALRRRTGPDRHHDLVVIRWLCKVRGFAWVPHSPHALVFAVKRDPIVPLPSEKPFLALWDGGPRLRYLLLGKLKANDDPDAEDLELVAVSEDGKSIVCEHEHDPGVGNGPYDVDKHRTRMVLPPDL